MFFQNYVSSIILIISKTDLYSGERHDWPVNFDLLYIER